jgi:growth factor-regulated tyrosine kinase substrate
MEFNTRIDQAVKMYDHLLQERLNSTYRQRMGANNYGNPGLQQQQLQQQQHHGGLNDSSLSFAPVGGQVYPHLSGPDPQYGAYAPVAPFTTHQPTQLPQQQQQPYAPYVPDQGYVPAPFASAPPPGPTAVFTGQYQAPLLTSSTLATSLATVSPPSSQQVGQFPGYAPMTAHAPGYTSGQGQTTAMPAYAPYSDPYQQQAPQQQHIAPVVPVEEKPLIEF